MKTSLTPAYTQAITPVYDVVYLSEDEVNNAIALIEKVRSSGTLEQQYHLKPKEHKDLAKNLENGAPLLGIKSTTGELIGFSMIYPLEDTKMVMMQSVCIDPTLTGLGLGPLLIQEAEQWAAQNNQTQLVAKVATDNTKSLSMYFKNGFRIAREGHDEQGNYDFCLVTKSINQNTPDIAPNLQNLQQNAPA